MDGYIIYGISSFVLGIIWFIRLEGRVNTIEKVFELYCKNSKETSDDIKKDIDNLFELTRRIDQLLNKLEGRIK